MMNSLDKAHITYFPLLLPPLAGTLVGLTSGICIRWEIGAFSIMPIHFVIVALWLAMIEALMNKSFYISFPFIIGACLGVIGGYLHNNGLTEARPGTMIICLLSGLAGTLIIIPGIQINGWKRSDRCSVLLVKPLIWSAASLLSILAMRFFNILARHSIPNENRSLMIAGVEVHHFLIGLLVASLLFAFLFCQSQRNRLSSFLAGLVFLCLALVADELSYIMIMPLTDAAYFGSSSMMGAIIAVAWLVGRANFGRLSGSTQKQNREPN